MPRTKLVCDSMIHAEFAMARRARQKKQQSVSRKNLDTAVILTIIDVGKEEGEKQPARNALTRALLLK